MLNEQETREMNSYSQLIDLCVAWGREHLLARPGEQWKSLEGAWDSLREQQGDLSADLKSGMIRLREMVGKAIAELSSPHTLLLDVKEAAAADFGNLPDGLADDADTEEPNIYIRINQALLVLDDVIYLREASRYFVPFRDLSVSCKDEIDQLVDLITIETDLPVMRLIPLNPLRRIRCENIPEKYHPLFPWYIHWSEMPADALDQLAESMAGLDDEETEETESVNLYVLSRQLVEDPALLLHIQKMAEAYKAIPRAVEQAYALRWQLESEEIAASLRMPTVVLDAGMVGAALRAVASAILRKKPISEAQFIAGYCAPSLSPEQSLKMLKPAEKMLQDNTLFFGQPLAEKLNQWKNKRTSGHELGTFLFNEWLRDLQAVAERGFVPLPEYLENKLLWNLLNADNPLSLAQMIKGLDALVFLPGSVFEKAKRHLEEISKRHEPAGELILQPEFTLGKERVRDESGMESLAFEEAGDIMLPMPVIKDDELGYGVKIRTMELLADISSSKLREYLKDRKYFWTAFAITTNGETKSFPPVAGSVPLIITLGQEEELQFLHLILCASPGPLQSIFDEKDKSGDNGEKFVSTPLIQKFYFQPGVADE